MTDNRPVYTVPPEELVALGKAKLEREKRSYEQAVARNDELAQEEHWKLFYEHVCAALALIP